MGGETALVHEVETLRAMVAERDREIAQLREYLRLLRYQRFGTKSERIPRDQLGLFNEAEGLAASAAEEKEPRVAVAAHTRTKQGRRPLPAWMPREEILHDLPAAAKVCPHDGTKLVEIARETSEQLEFVPATAKVLVHVRPRYGCPTCKTGVHTAPLLPQPIPKSLATPSLLAYVAVSKYADALPLYRQEQILGRLGIDLSRATLASWMVRAGALVQPLMNRMREELLASGFVQCDESRLQVLREPGKAAESLSYMWVQRGGPVDHPLILYEYDPSRSAEVPKRLFAGFRGVLQTDGYEGYGAIGREPGVVHVGCWAHARHKFIEALEAQGASRKKRSQRKARHSLADEGLGFFQDLYAIERRPWNEPITACARMRRWAWMGSRRKRTGRTWSEPPGSARADEGEAMWVPENSAARFRKFLPVKEENPWYKGERTDRHLTALLQKRGCLVLSATRRRDPAARVGRPSTSSGSRSTGRGPARDVGGCFARHAVRA